MKRSYSHHKFAWRNLYECPSLFTVSDFQDVGSWNLHRKALLIPNYSNAYANAIKWNFDVQFPGNWFEFGIIGNDFWSFYNLDFLDPSFNRCLKIPKLPEFNLFMKLESKKQKMFQKQRLFRASKIISNDNKL